MNYDETLAFIHGIPRFAKKPGLRRIKALMERMGNPQDKLRFIHVAGTSGKGSICAMLSHILTRAGYKTGLYVSPYIVDFRERMQVDNQMISEDELVSCAALVKTHWDELAKTGEPPSELEFVAATAFEFFYRRKCDVVVLEVGMGGLTDSTNVIGTPLVSVIGSIGFDHTEYLGGTIREIAAQKCGIIKGGGVTVCYPRQKAEALDVVRSRCEEESNRLLIPGDAEVRHMGIDGSDIVWNGMELRIPLAGEHQIYNAMTALEVIRALELTSMRIPPEAVTEGMAQTVFPARFEVIGGDPMIILDSAHNPDKLKALADTLSVVNGRKIHGVMALMRDKDIPACLSHILPLFASVSVSAVPGWPRSLAADELADACRPLCAHVTATENPEEALAHAVSLCDGDDLVAACGSMYIMTALREMALRMRSPRILNPIAIRGASL